MGAPLIGARIARKEDYRFLTGAGQYTDDVTLPRQTYAAFVRSPHAHAKIKSVNTAKAKGAPGVLAVYTGEDIAAAKLGGLPCGWLITDVNGQPMKEPPHPCLAQGKVRHVGDPVAAVVATTLEHARDAAEKVEVDYEVLPAVVDPVKASAKGADKMKEMMDGGKDTADKQIDEQKKTADAKSGKMNEVGQKAAVLVQLLRPDGHAELDVVAVRPPLVRALAVPAALRLEAAAPVEEAEVAQVGVGHEDDVAAVAAVAAVGAALRHVLLTPEREGAVAAAPAFDADPRAVVEHGIS